MWRLIIGRWCIASIERDDDEQPPDGITGGSMMCFDRDDNPPDAMPGEDWDWEDRQKFGFS